MCNFKNTSVKIFRVVNAQGGSQTVQIKMPEKTSLNLQQVQGIKSVVPSNGSTTSTSSTTLDNSNFQTSFMKEVAQAKKGQ